MAVPPPGLGALVAPRGAPHPQGAEDRDAGGSRCPGRALWRVVARRLHRRRPAPLGPGPPRRENPVLRVAVRKSKFRGRALFLKNYPTHCLIFDRRVVDRVQPPRLERPGSARVRESRRDAARGCCAPFPHRVDAGRGPLPHQRGQGRILRRPLPPLRVEHHPRLAS